MTHQCGLMLTYVLPGSLARDLSPMKRSLALLVLFAFAVGLIGAHPCQAKETRSAVPHCHAMPEMPGMPRMGRTTPAPALTPSLHAQGHGCCGLPGQAPTAA